MKELPWILPSELHRFCAFLQSALHSLLLYKLQYLFPLPTVGIGFAVFTIASAETFVISLRSHLKRHFPLFPKLFFFHVCSCIITQKPNYDYIIAPRGDKKCHFILHLPQRRVILVLPFRHYYGSRLPDLPNQAGNSQNVF